MAKSINQVTIMGNLTKRPDVKGAGNSVVAQFPLALNRSYKDKDDNWQEATDFVDVVVWGRLAEQVQENLTIGSRCLVSGRIQSRAYEKDGVRRTKVEILALDVTFLEKASPIEVM